MKKLALIAGAGLLALGSVGSAEAQRFRYDDDDWGHSRRVVRERVVVRHAPVIRQRIVYRPAPIIRQRVVYRRAPVVRQRVVYRPAPVYRTQRVVYRQAPVYQTQRVVYRAAPIIRQRVVYQQPRARVVYNQPVYNTRVTYRQPQRDRVIVRRTNRDDIDVTGSIGDRREMRMQRRMMRDW